MATLFRSPSSHLRFCSLSSRLLSSFQNPNPRKTLRLDQIPKSFSPNTPHSLSDPRIAAQIVSDLRRSNAHLILSSIASLNRSIVVDLLLRCASDPQSSQKFVRLLLQKPNSITERHGPLARQRRPILRRQGPDPAHGPQAWRLAAEAVKSLICTNFSPGAGAAAVDLLIRTYEEARKLREASEAFRNLRVGGVLLSVNAYNSLLGALVKTGWTDMAWDIYWEMERARIPANVYMLNFIS